MVKKNIIQNISLEPNTKWVTVMKLVAHDKSLMEPSEATADTSSLGSSEVKYAKVVIILYTFYWMTDLNI